VAKVAGQSLLTIEGLAADAHLAADQLHPVQQAFLDEGAYQCGYCVSGMIIAATALLKDNPHPTDDEIKDGMDNNLCRCCGYAKIVSAVRRAATLAGGKA
jgi:carbon-monoxide dehydrogenase small subunit